MRAVLLSLILFSLSGILALYWLYEREFEAFEPSYEVAQTSTVQPTESKTDIIAVKKANVQLEALRKERKASKQAQIAKKKQESSNHLNTYKNTMQLASQTLQNHVTNIQKENTLTVALVKNVILSLEEKAKEITNKEIILASP